MAKIERVAPEALTPGESKYPLPSTAQILIVTPEMASDWLSYRNHPKNRPLSKSVSAKYQAAQEAVLVAIHEARQDGLSQADVAYMLGGVSPTGIKAKEEKGREIRERRRGGNPT